MRRSAGSAHLSRERIAAAALELLDRDGLDAFSMRRLADHLSVGTMTLYGYFRGKSELLDAVMDEAAAEVDLTDLPDSWRERAGGLARAWRANLERHPALVQIRLREPMMRPRQFRTTEASVQALLDAGLPPGDAARAFRVLFTYTFGFVAFSPSATADDARRHVRAGLAALPPDEYPAIAAMADEAAAAVAGDEQFDYGLELVLDGIEARAERR
jgi:AcrR family transcriptional regulator